MLVTTSTEVEKCYDCPYVSNSSQEHNCPFTSAPHPTIWYCNHPDRKKKTDYRFVGSAYTIDKYCPLTN